MGSEDMILTGVVGANSIPYTHTQTSNGGPSTQWQYQDDEDRAFWVHYSDGSDTCKFSLNVGPVYKVVPALISKSTNTHIHILPTHHSPC